MNTAIPCADEARKTDTRTEIAPTIATASARARAGRTTLPGVQSPSHARDRERDQVHDDHVRGAGRRRSSPARHEKRSSSERADHQRLQQAGVRIASHHTVRQEDREHASQEEHGEHREAEDRPADERLLVHQSPAGEAHVLDLGEREACAQRVEHEEGGGQGCDDRDYPPPQAFGHGVADDDPRVSQAPHVASSPTASR